MTTTRYIYWQEDGMWLGYLKDFPEYWTQGKSRGELLENLYDISQDAYLLPVAER